MSELFGATIDKKVIEEIERREQHFQQRGGSDFNENNGIVRYTNTKGAWIRMISSVNLEKRDEDDNTYFSDLEARTFVLGGGEYLTDSQNNISMKEGIDFESLDRTKAYRLTENLGVRPQGGITSFDITHKGTYGSLRECNVQFNVWSVEDLELAQQLFLRPGVHAIIEWGHTQSSELNSPRVNIPPINEYFELRNLKRFRNENEKKARSTTKKPSRRTLVSRMINQYKEQADFNYDGFIGLVTNFSWSFRKDGGYDCSLKIVSAGAIIESLTMMNAEDICPPVGQKEQLSYKKRSLLHAIIAELEAFFNSPGLIKSETKVLGSSSSVVDNTTEVEYEISGDNLAVYSSLLKNDAKTYPFPSIPTNIDPFLIINKALPSDIEDDETYSDTYIPFWALLEIINEAQNLEGEKQLRGTNTIPIDTSEEARREKFTTIDEHFSIQPRVCLLTKTPKISDKRKEVLLQRSTQANLNGPGRPAPYVLTEEERIKIIVNREQELLSKLHFNEVETTFVSDKKEASSTTMGTLLTTDKNSDTILDLWINLANIRSTLDSFFTIRTDDLAEINVYDFLKQILTDINSALGSLTNLDLHYIEEQDVYRIVNRDPIIGKDKKIEKFNFAGLKNTASDITIETKITSQLASQIAIAAQGEASFTNKYGNLNIPLLQWNKGIKDRFRVKPSAKASRCFNSEEDIVSRKEEIENRLYGSKDNMGILANREGTSGGSLIYDLKNAIANNVNVDQNKAKLKQLEQEARELEIELIVLDGQNLDYIPYFLNPSVEAYEAFTRGITEPAFGYSLFGNTKQVFSRDYFSSLRRYANVYFKEALFYENYDIDKNNALFTGIIPIELSITLDGISGFKIGQVFKLNNIERFLPKVYLDYGFILVGIDSKIENNKWFTTLRALTFKLP